MPNLNYILAYVADARRSAELYGKLFNLEPVESSPTFAMFALPNGLTLGLWAQHEVEPKATRPGGSELAFAVPDNETVRRTFGEWQALGLKPVQEPTNMDFGYTFTAEDPDGHRLRVFAPGA